MNHSAGRGDGPYIVLPRLIVQSCSDAAQKAFWAAVALIDGEAAANMPELWPGGLHVRVRLQDPATGRALRDPLADSRRERLWEATSES